jgi:plasmid stabilization system protein ParE
MARLKWLPEAIKDIERLYNFLKEKDTEAAKRAAYKILEGSTLLRASPRLGRPMNDNTERRELSVAFGAGSYVLRYVFESDDVVTIIRVWHSRENRE